MRLHTNCDLCMSALMGNNLMYGFPLATLSLLFFRSIHSEGHTGVNTVPTSCGGSLPKGSGAQVDMQLSFSFSIYIKCHHGYMEGIFSELGNRLRLLAQKSSFLEDSRHLCA